MPTYKITDPDTGLTVTIEGDSPPSEQEISIIFRDVSASQPNMARSRGGFMNTDKGNVSQRALERGIDPRSLYEPTPAEDMGGLGRFMTGAAKGMSDPYFGSLQLGAHLIPGIDPSGIDQEVADRERYYQEGGLADTPSGQFGNVAGTTASLLGPGMAGLKVGERVAGALPKVAAPFIEGAAAGAVEGAMMPTSGDNYWGDKSGQVLWGAGLGGGANTGMQALLRGGTGVRNLPNRARNAPSDMLRAANQGPLQVPNTANRFGIDLTLGQATGNKPLQFMEQRARESFISAGKVAEGDLIRAQQLNNALRQVAGDATTPITGRQLQQRAQKHVTDLYNQRSRSGRAMYGEIDRLAQGQKIVQPRNLYDELNAIIKEAGTQEGGDIVAAAKQARAMLETIDNQGGYTAQEALGRLQNYSNPKTQAFTDVGRSYDAVLKRRIYSALMADMEETAAKEGASTLGQMVKNANKTWRNFSEQINSAHDSVFGKMLGREAGEGAVTANSVSPKQVIQKLSRMDYSDAKNIMKYMDENFPEMAPKVRGSILNDAIDAATMGPPSGGANFVFNPNQFLSALGLKSGTAGVEGMKRLEAIFGAGTRQWRDVQDLIGIARRMGDAYGKNFSGTSQANAFVQLLRDFTNVGIGSARRLGSTGLEFAGLQKIANSMKPGTIDFGNLQPRPLIQPPRITTPLSRAAGVVAYPLLDEK